MTATVVITISDDVQAKLDELVAENYALDDMIEFIQENGEENFLEFYEEYVQCGEDYSYDAVEAFVGEFGIECIANFTDAYYGQYDSEEQFAEQFVGDCYHNQLQDLPIVIDWTATWESNLRYDFSFADGFVFHKNF